MPQIDSFLTAKLNVDNAISDAIDDPSLLRLDPVEKSKRVYIFLNSTLTTPKRIVEIPTKSFVDYEFKDPSIIKKTQIILISTIKFKIRLALLK